MDRHPYRLDTLALDAVIARRLERWAVRGYPREVCGWLLGRNGAPRVTVRRATRGRNLARHRPHDRFELGPESFLEADRVARASGLDVVGVWHTHPDHPARPSETDLEAAWSGYVYLILAVARQSLDEVRAWTLEGDSFTELAVEPRRTREEVLS